MPEVNCILSDSDNFVHLTSEVIPDWVKRLDSIKDKIEAELKNPSQQMTGIKFCDPLNVIPASKK
ncbi:MAG: hypothetical protein JNL60_13465 [Bacteroidia bacterium]|nr:hypothetical protein [Bacteroidia bacterium]